MNKNGIKAILFDSGRTLNIPRTGHWFITPNFNKIIENTGFVYKKGKLNRGMKKASTHISKINFVRDEKEEFQMFKEFYGIVLHEIKHPSPTNELIELLAWDNVYNDEKFLFFDDVEPSLEKLKSSYSLGIVSDTWPSLERVFINKHLRNYFDTFVMSSIYGSLKAEKKLFEIALKELNLEPHEAIFVDDSKANLKAAEEFGMIPVLIDRYEDKKLKSMYPIIRSIAELL